MPPALPICVTRGRCTATVLLVRHADVSGHGDPPLNAAGQVRAQELRRVLGDAGVSAILVSPLQRTQLTAAPLAAHLGLTPGVHADVASAVAAIRSRPTGSTALVVGHSNTVPEIIAALGGPAIAPIAATEFDNLYVLAHRRVTRLHYGA